MSPIFVHCPSLTTSPPPFLWPSRGRGASQPDTDPASMTTSSNFRLRFPIPGPCNWPPAKPATRGTQYPRWQTSPATSELYGFATSCRTAIPTCPHAFLTPRGSRALFIFHPQDGVGPVICNRSPKTEAQRRRISDGPDHPAEKEKRSSIGRSCAQLPIQPSSEFPR